MTDTTTMEQFWKKRYNEADKTCTEYITLASKMTGYFGSLAKYDSSIPKHVKIRMLQGLIDMWNNVDPNSTLTQEWIKGWEKEIKEISK